MLKISLFNSTTKIAEFTSPISQIGSRVMVDGKVFSTANAEFVSIVEGGKFVGIEVWGCKEIKNLERW